MATIRYKFFVEWQDPTKFDSKIELQPYSGCFNSLKVADKWFHRYGKKLQNIFDRKLILCIYEHGKNSGKYDVF